MSREEEIEQASKCVFKSKMGARTAFIRGCEYADRHPREGLWDAEKVIKYIKEELPYYVELNCVFDEIRVNYSKIKNNFIHDLKKAMED